VKTETDQWHCRLSAYSLFSDAVSNRLYVLNNWMTVNNDRLERILTMMYVVQNSQNFSGLFPPSYIPKNTTFRKPDLFPKRRVFWNTGRWKKSRKTCEFSK
jgi:hypothetical protein